jgi:hypothetical protein
MVCFTWIVLIAGGVFVMITLLRWFEQITEAVDAGWWNKVITLIFMPFTVWFYASRVAAGRPTAVPRHEPVRGFGTLPKSKPPVGATSPSDTSEPPMANLAPGDRPPPGTPKEFLGMPVIPPKKSGRRAPPIDPEKLQKLRHKMREQGMLDDDES